MISFKQFVLESEDGGAHKLAPVATDAQNIYSPQEVSTEEFINWCESNASKYLQSISKPSSAKIFRGFKGINSHIKGPIGPNDINTSVGKIDSNKMNRVSANTFNYYTLWMDNHPSWSEFPKRSKSLVCSTNLITASNYARKSYAQLMIPADSNKIGICSDDDLWTSFDALSDMAENSVSRDRHFTMDTFMTVLYYGLSGLGIPESEVSSLQTNYSKFEAALKRATRADIQKIIESLDDADFGERKYKDLEKLLGVLEHNNLNNLHALFERGLDPSSNNFKVTAAGSFKISDNDVEVWVQGQCYTIDTMYIEKVCKDKSNKMMYDFLNKYNLCAGWD